MSLFREYFIPPEDPPEPSSTLDALRFVRVYEPDLARALEEAAHRHTMMTLVVKGYDSPTTRRLVIALLRSAHAWNVPVLITPQCPPIEENGVSENHDGRDGGSAQCT